MKRQESTACDYHVAISVCVRLLQLNNSQNEGRYIISLLCAFTSTLAQNICLKIT